MQNVSFTRGDWFTNKGTSKSLYCFQILLSFIQKLAAIGVQWRQRQGQNHSQKSMEGVLVVTKQLKKHFNNRGYGAIPIVQKHYSVHF